jgi:hypothetical protein
VNAKGRLALSFALLFGTVAIGEGTAFAFCRTTTCKCKSDKKLPDAPNGLPRSTCGEPDGECPRDEHGCVTKGTPVAWRGGCIGYSANLIGTAQLSDEEWNEAFRQAFHAWQLVDCGGGSHPSIELYALRPTNCAESSYDAKGPNVNSIYFTDQGWSGPQTPENLDHVLARAKINFESSGEIVDGDIAINSARKEFTVTDTKVREDLVSILTHEVGHFLGIGHSDVPEAVMYWQYGTGSIRRRLDKDDIEAICTIYPPDRETTCDPTPRGGLRDTCGTTTEVERAGCATAPIREHTHFASWGIGILGFVVVQRITNRLRVRSRR